MRQGSRARVEPSQLLTPARREEVRVETNRWIKRLRHVRYGAGTMRGAFTYRGDSLWWFTELYLHKMQQLDRAISTVVALDAAREAFDPTRMVVDTSSRAVCDAALAFGRARNLRIDVGGDVRRDGIDRFSYLSGLAARLSRLRPTAPRHRNRETLVAAFIHTAFWKDAASADGVGGERYVGPLLEAIQSRLSRGHLTCVGVGPRRNFRARRWWDPIVGGGAPQTIVPVERLAPLAALSGSSALWKQRRSLADAVTTGPSVREAAEFRGCDLWPVLGEELRRAALLQWPWSARAMDEAGAALDALAPRVVVTYAEAGGWGRALVLEARRRGIPSVGAQHGFIYRHWLNYAHEADEWLPENDEAGVPAPDRTLLFDRYAAAQLESTGSFPPGRLRVTGSPGLDHLAARIRALTPGDRIAVRRQSGATDQDKLVILAAKFSEIRTELEAIFAAVASLDGVRLVVKVHPAETAALYRPYTNEAAGVSVAPVTADLARLLGAADGLITMNSTVAIDALVLGLPSLVVGLPNNLSPFVDAGVMMGEAGGSTSQLVERLLYDREARDATIRRAAAFAEHYGMRADGGAAIRGADQVLALMKGESP